MDVSRLRGSIVPLVTPFREGRVDEEALRGLVEWQIASGSHGVSVCGTTGEPTSLSVDERKRVIELAVRAAAGRVPVVAGVGTNHHGETVEMAQFAEQAGADALLVLVPYHVRPTQEGLYQHFRAVARSTRLPVIVYNIPGRTAVNLEVETLARLRRDCENVVGVKEANRDFEHVNRVLWACGRDFLLFSGIEVLCYPMLAIGGAGFISATANLVPDRLSLLYERWRAGDVRGALELHYELLPLNEVLFVETNPGPVKYALGLLGRIHPEVRLPLVLPSEANRRRIRQTLVQYGLLPADAPAEVTA
ncbi:MAG: 2,4-dihydroxyhept-2-ene-1,7-dioic acid aldolase [Armatimonadota bacterium]|nr:2,4-dihydroxyhept-2-ene-1,7-dioic acid aldolase [Armatimonadota bacterium]MDR5677007.1 2,4-dihydroxyhept-2-ene-1,7-dioic acid aldolase [Armatimonadota bacterium]MDR5689665.1 2,4-dihydroxyhept-2-ene-1,7-dioic acid aldolase [Armatimonadota bacterium]MDR7387728.1 2,4-dihydroxyhept-2-ene-1,7-dioic acid aldolase [Armatimonadota bacterium]MDR7390408.1 2,4-dihydroxyhept-2-ene-1,7-dioic acid aldolase [Armatimonadota bacterium]